LETPFFLSLVFLGIGNPFWYRLYSTRTLIDFIIVSTIFLPLLQKFHNLKQGQAGEPGSVRLAQSVGVWRGTVCPGERYVLHREIRMLDHYNWVLALELEMEYGHFSPA